MSYRDELSAALARIHALETKLADFHKQSGQEQLDAAKKRFDAGALELEKASATLGAENTRMHAALALLQKDHQEALHELVELRARFYGVVPARAPRAQPTLVEHNREFPEHAYPDKLAGVLCPVCVYCEEEIEMMYTGSSSQKAQEKFFEVICPKCGHTGRKRIML